MRVEKVRLALAIVDWCSFWASSVSHWFRVEQPRPRVLEKRLDSEKKLCHRREVPHNLHK